MLFFSHHDQFEILLSNQLIELNVHTKTEKTSKSVRK
jgi:hypothetical protein